MFAHRLSVRAGELGSQGADALVELLYLGLAQDGAGSLVLQSLHQGREEVDVLRLDRSQLVVVLGQDKGGGRRGRGRLRRLLLQRGRMFPLLFLHVGQGGGNGSLQFDIILLFLDLWHRLLEDARSLRLQLRLSHVASARVTFDFVQTHLQGSLQVFVEAIVDSRVARLHGRGRSRPRAREGSTAGTLERDRGRACLVHESGVAAIVDADGLHDTQMWQGDGLARAGATEDVSAVSAVMLAIREAKGVAAPHAHIRVRPFWRL